MALPAFADTAGRPDDGVADEVYYDISGPSYPEDKTGGEGLSSPSFLSTSMVMMGGPLDSVTFPYSNQNWTIDSWYSTSDGLRFVNAAYKGELILADYRTPWVTINGVRRALSTQQLVQGPDLSVYYSGYFLVTARYNLGNPNVDVTVVTRFYGTGTIEPWVLVNGFTVSYNIGVGQRFDFDLGGTLDDNQQHYDGTVWKTNANEYSTLDSAYAENGSGFQWRDFDTDASGNSNFIDQEVDITPYSSDASRWYSLAYSPGQLNSDPGGYINGQTINQYVGGQPDPWIGYDAVNWYVSSYSSVTLAYPGPWIRAVV